MLRKSCMQRCASAKPEPGAQVVLGEYHPAITAHSHVVDALPLCYFLRYNYLRMQVSLCAPVRFQPRSRTYAWTYGACQASLASQSLLMCCSIPRAHLLNSMADALSLLTGDRA
jgi:hypothetical protein